MSLNATTDNLVGQRVASYKLTKRLGLNRICGTYLGVHTDTETVAAVQLIHPMIATGPQEDLFADAETAGSLDHPYAVPLFDWGWSETLGVNFIVRDYVDGQSLRHRLRSTEKLPPMLVSRIVHGVAELLALAHEEGIIHGNLNPANVLIATATDEAGHEQIKVLDLGLIPASTPVGTPPYAAPEQSCGAPGIDQRADIYALGAITYEALSGRPPFEGIDAAEIVSKQLNASPPPLSYLGVALPDGVERALMRALARDPAQRFAAVTELSRAFPARLPPAPPARNGGITAAAGDAATTANGPSEAKTEAKVEAKTESGEVSKAAADEERQRLLPGAARADEGTKSLPLRTMMVIVIAVGAISYLAWGGQLGAERQEERDTAAGKLQYAPDDASVPAAPSGQRAQGSRGTSDSAAGVDSGARAARSTTQGAEARKSPRPLPGKVSRRRRRPGPRRLPDKAPPGRTRFKRIRRLPDKVVRPTTTDRRVGDSATTEASVIPAKVASELGLRKPGDRVPKQRKRPLVPGKMSTAFKAGQYRQAYWLAKAHLGENPGHTPSLVVLGLSACAMKRESAAGEAYAALRGKARARVAAACRRQGITLGRSSR